VCVCKQLVAAQLHIPGEMFLQTHSCLVMMVSSRVLAKQSQLHEVGARPGFKVMENSMRNFVAL
jgi:hypothetical protein